MSGHLKSFGQQGPTQGMNSVTSKYKDPVRQALHFFCVPPPSSDYMVDFHRIRFSKNKNHLMHQPKKRGQLLVISALKILISYIRAAAAS